MATQVIDIVARDKTKGVLGGIEKSLGRIAGLAAAAFSVGALTNYANSVQTITNRLKLVTNGQNELASTFRNLTDVANRSRQDLDAVTDLYQKIALSTKDLGLNQTQVARTTETFSKLLSIAGANTQSASGAIRQFAQALGSGAFRGDEFNSVVEAAPQILDILAKETGKARGEIRALAGDGKLTADVLINALLKASKDVDAQFAKTGPTIGQSFTVLKNNFLALGTTASPVFDALAKGILFVANNLEKAVVAALSFGAAMAVGKVIAMTRAVGGLTMGVKALTAAMMRNPLTLFAVAIAGAITLAYDFLKPLFQIEASLGTKILYAIERAGNAFLGFFSGVGKAAFEFGKMLVAAINPFDDIDVEDAFNGFGDRLKKAFQEGSDVRVFNLVSDEDRANVEKQLADLNKQAQDALNKGDGTGEPLTLTPKVDPKEAENALKNLQGLQKELYTELERINAQYEERKAVLAKATDEQIKSLNTTRADLERKIEEDLQKDLKEIKDKGLADDKRRRDEQINQALRYADETKRIEYERTQAIKEINALSDEALKEVGISRTEAITNANKTANEATKKILKDQEEKAKEAAKNEAIEKLKQQGRTQEQAEKYYEFEKSSQLDKTKFALSQGKTILEGLGAYSEKAFKAAKAFAIAEAVINTYQGATKALASYPPPFNFIAAAAVVASGLAQVATIRSQQPVGRQRGGALRAGQTSIIGEGGPELFVPKQPGTVIPNEVATALEGMGGRSEPVVVNFNISTVDAQGFDELLIRRRATITGIINNALTKQGKQGVLS